MRVHILGARGSTPATGPAFVRYGGSTSCVALAQDGAAPSLVLDAGTGLRGLSALLRGEAFRGVLLLGHLHWDHTQGLPFSRAVDSHEAEVRLCLPDQQDGLPPVEVLRRAMSPPHFPIGPEDLRGRWRLDGLAPGVHWVGGFEVLALEIPHKGGRTFGYRITDGHSAIAYLSDHGPSALGGGPEGWGPYHQAAMILAEGVDVLVHDAQHTAAEFGDRAGWGHSVADYAVGLGERAGVGSVLLFHHDPTRSDDEIDELVRTFADAGVPVAAAAEGTMLNL